LGRQAVEDIPSDPRWGDDSRLPQSSDGKRKGTFPEGHFLHRRISRKEKSSLDSPLRSFDENCRRPKSELSENPLDRVSLGESFPATTWGGRIKRWTST